MNEAPSNPGRKPFLKIDVSGKSNELWTKTREKLLKAMDSLLDSVIDSDKGSTVREEAKQFTTAILDHARQRLRKQGLDNEEIEARIRRIHIDCEHAIAETRGLHARAEALEIQNAVTKMRLALGTQKAMLICEEGDEAIVFIRQVDGFLSVLREISVHGESMDP